MTYMDNKMSSAEVSPVRPDTSSSYLRKIKKPLIERKRRERINNCLTQLKSILLDNIKQNGGTQVSKLDKADILEMTVSHLRQIHHQQLSAAMAASTAVVHKYREGYTECAAEAVRYMESSRAYPSDMVMRMRSNLTTKVAYSVAPYGHGLGQPRLAISSKQSDLSVSRQRSSESECHKTPVKVKVESMTSPCNVTCSPDSGFESAFSPLLMTVPFHNVKTEMDKSRVSPKDTCTSTVRMSPSTSEGKTSQSSVLALPPRVAVPVSVVGDSPSQKQVWRPF
ncbi:HES4-like protein [Mya arenaria]|uniref:HES4-like protein n=1 Tax=Mya arenaria TaxID=6604 RepID=A0ABY7EXL4_MYAAR|nr:enhancer of split mbeta protein-like [Mya arenaria]WAR14610.1 HES4-like protein [Mya arenaria]